MSLLAVPAYAEEESAVPEAETVVAPAPPAAAPAPVAAEPPAPPAPTPPSKSAASESPAPINAGAEELRKRQLQTSSGKIELLRAEVKATQVEKGFLSFFSSAVRPVDTNLLAEMGSFIDLFPELAETAEIYHLKAQVHKRIENYHAATLDWLMLLAAYPDSKFAAEAHKGLKELSGNKLKKQAEIIKAMTDKISSLGGDRDQRIASFLIFLGTQNEADFALPIAAECAAFLGYNRTYLDEDLIVHAQAHQQMLVSNEVAAYHFNKLLALYPASPLRPDSLLSLGTIQRKGLKLYDRAVTSFKAVIEKYPDSGEAKQAYESLANMYDEDIRDYKNATRTYDAIVARYKDDPVVLRGLQAQALIYRDKTGQPKEAIASYRKLAETFKGKEGLDALLSAERLARNTIKDWELSIEINELIIAAYPDNDEAVKALFNNAEIHEDQLKNREQAIDLYKELIDRHPKHDLASDAKRRISSLEQKK
jgi:tetratricopeptide (TPR) repeat protein